MLIKLQNFKASTEFEPMTTPFTYSAAALGSFYVSGKLPTDPSPKPTLTLTSHLGQNAGSGEVGSFPEM